MKRTCAVVAGVGVEEAEPVREGGERVGRELVDDQRLERVVERGERGRGARPTSSFWRKVAWNAGSTSSGADRSGVGHVDPRHAQVGQLQPLGEVGAEVDRRRRRLVAAITLSRSATSISRRRTVAVTSAPRSSQLFGLQLRRPSLRSSRNSTTALSLEHEAARRRAAGRRARRRRRTAPTGRTAWPGRCRGRRTADSRSSVGSVYAPHDGEVDVRRARRSGSPAT